MDYFEHEESGREQEYTAPQPQEPVYTPPQPEETVYTPPVSQSYSGAGVGRKESPFADSPYVMNHTPYQTSYQGGYVPPAAPQQPPVKSQKKKSGKAWKAVLSVVLTLVLVAGSCGITATMVNQRWETQTRQMSASFNAQLEEMQEQIDAASAAASANSGHSVSGTAPVGDGMTPGQVYAQNVDSVVLITCKITSSAYGQSVTGSSTGSGFILSEDGYVVTNAHVVEGATSVVVTIYGGEELQAQVVGSDSTNDVAVLKVEATGLSAVALGSSDDLIVGDQVVAIGNPLGELTATMTAGYVSAKNRDVTTDDVTISMIQTDAAINSGNSGGPLFNMKGEVVGITTAKYSGASSSGATIEGIGFAIPIDDVVGMVEDLVNYGYVTGAYLGVMVSDMDASAAAYYGMPVGAYVQEVTPGYCAEAAGLQVKDIIVALGEHEVSSISTLTRALRNFEAGDTTTITVYRGGREISLSITLDEKPAVTDSTTTVPSDSDMPKDGSYEEWYDYFSPFFGDGNG